MSRRTKSALKHNVRNTIKKKGGAPTKYRKEFTDLTFRFCLLGATDEELAEYLSIYEKISYSCIIKWKQTIPKFLQAIRKGRDEALGQVIYSLFHKANGYSHPEDKIFYDSKIGKTVTVKTTKHYPPDTAAIKFIAWNWTRALEEKKRWTDRQEIDHSSTDGTMTPAQEITMKMDAKNASDIYKQMIKDTKG